jgi:hypothetical protein
MIESNGEPVLVDYGLAQIIDTTQFTSARSQSTVPWTAPELMETSDDDDDSDTAQGGFTKESDVFAFAMLVVEVRH